MNKKYIVYLGLILAVVFTSLVSASPRLYVTSTEQDAGTFTKGEQVKGTFPVKNKGDEPLDLSIISSCECLTVEPASYQLQPGEDDFVIKYNIDTNELEGQASRDIIVETNDPDFPVIYVTIKVLVKSNGDEIIEKDNDESVKESDINIRLYSSRDCSICKKIKEEFIPEIEMKNNISVTVDFYDLSDIEEYKKFMAVRDAYNAGDQLPVLIVGDTALSGKKQIYDDLEVLLLKSIATGDKEITINDDATGDTGSIKDILSLSIIISAGLLDGINPCAFAVILLLVSFLLVRSSSKKEVLIAGSIYTFAVFISYLLVGFGLQKILKEIFIFDVARLVVKWGISVVLIVFAGLSLYDFFKVKAGKENEMILQLPDFLKKKIRQEFRGKIRVGSIIVTPFILGFIVSALELACTGQIYIPTIIVMLKSGERVLVHSLLLLLYNLMFIMPLIIVFLLVYFGISSQKIQDVFTKNMGLVKIFITGLFLVFAVATFLLY